MLGGTFDPVHIGHMIVAEVLRVRLRLSSVMFLPAGRPPHKPDQTLSSDEDRIAMLERAIDGYPHFSVCRLDIQRPGPSFTADSVQALSRNVSKHAELYFLMGQDSLRDFPTWRDPERIVTYARLGVALRPGVVVELSEIQSKIPESEGRVEVVAVPLIDVSSSGIRQAVRSGGPYRYQVLPEVAQYIEERSLYRQDTSHQYHS